MSNGATRSTSSSPDEYMDTSTDTSTQAEGGAALQQELASAGMRLRDVTVVISTDDARARGSRAAAAGHGSGIVWSADTVVTNAHVAVADRLRVAFADGEQMRARVIVRDRGGDLALLRLEEPRADFASRPVARIGDPQLLRAGDLVIANGHPLGVEHALSLGVVHSAPRDASNPYISADIRLAPGNSGGPLADASGRVVGVNSMIVGGLALAISTDAVRRLIAAATPRPSLGVELRTVQVRLPLRADSTSVGLLVLRCDETGAAARAGIIAGDVLLGFAGKPFRSPSELAQLLRDAGAHASLRLDVGRAQRQFSVTVQLGAPRSRHRHTRHAA